MVVEPYQPVILNVVVNGDGGIDANQRHGAAEEKIVHRNCRCKKNLLGPVERESFAPLLPLPGQIRTPYQDQDEEQGILEDHGGAMGNWKGNHFCGVLVM